MLFSLNNHYIFIVLVVGVGVQQHTAVLGVGTAAGSTAGSIAGTVAAAERLMLGVLGEQRERPVEVWGHRTGRLLPAGLQGV